MHTWEKRYSEGVSAAKQPPGASKTHQQRHRDHHTEELEKQDRRAAVTPQQEQFVTQLCAQGLASVVLRWVDRGMPQNSVDWLEDFYAIMDGSMDFMLERLAQRRQKN